MPIAWRTMAVQEATFIQQHVVRDRYEQAEVPAGIELSDVLAVAMWLERVHPIEYLRLRTLYKIGGKNASI